MSIIPRFKKAADSFNNVDRMVTRKIPVPGLEYPKCFLQMEARRDRNGFWSLAAKEYMPEDALYKTEALLAVIRTIIKKHANDPSSGRDSVNFDAAFFILRETEETLLKDGSTPSGAEPDHHYMQAFRLLARPMQDGLNDIYQARLGKTPPVEPPAALPPENLGPF